MRFNPAYVVLSLISASCAAPLVADVQDIHARANTFPVEFVSPPGHELKPGKPTETIKSQAKYMIELFFTPEKVAEIHYLPKGSKPSLVKDYPFAELPNPPEVGFMINIGGKEHKGSVTLLPKTRMNSDNKPVVIGEMDDAEIM
ncbi:hypothetical protein BT96DRAFT_937698 [Gymnopus androsaceus JB14]|uniref:Uncharacterized protein n=1 Tax=Gymnopus androsaceus JB14 TaxID=1447944 RepID=A0A6A4HYZ7_9AGAR|nr:hypothetical protein BT96DRAFT_937698 [Gymnopus androsaceus JB14]